MAETNGFAPEYLETLTRLLEQNDEIAKHTQELPRIADEIRQLRIDLVAILANRTPEGSIPLATHQELMKTQSRLSAVMVLVAVGLGPSVEKIITWLAT